MGRPIIIYIKKVCNIFNIWTIP